MKFFKLLLLNLFVALTLGNAIASVYGTDPVAMSGGVFFAGLLTSTVKTQGVHALNSVTVEIWENFIANNLFKGKEWLKRSKDRSEHVLNGAVVHIPQAGALPKVVKNRSVYPVPMIQRNDADVTYALDLQSAEAIRIPEAEAAELSYDKQESVFGDYRGVLTDELARDVLNRWYPSVSANIIRSTGGDTAVYLTGQTGTRKKYLVADIETAKTQLNVTTKKESGDRVLVMTEGAYNQIKSDSVVKDKDTMDSVGAVWKDGDLIKIHGMDIVRTDVTSRYDNTGTPVLKDTEAANAATDNDVILMYDAQFVHRAVGEIKFFETLNDALAQGDIYSATVKAGGRKERSDEAGCVAIVQVA